MKFDECPFRHDNIEVLYGVPYMPIEKLPKVCTCGKPLTYVDVVMFVSYPTFVFPDCEDVIIEEQFVFSQLEDDDEI